jgi:ABC-type transport system involved in multi-copper enzyme maturation permease subunit
MNTSIDSADATKKSTALLRYRPWRGHARSAAASLWPITRTALEMIFRRRIFWVLYAFALLIFLMFFFGQYLLAFAESQATEQSIMVGGVRTAPSELMNFMRRVLKIDGNAEMYRFFFGWQGYMVMVVLALAGAVLVGNDFQHGSLPFYLSKPISRWHYIVGKCLAVGVFVNLLTTIPALVLFVQYGFLDSWDYFVRDWVDVATFSFGSATLTMRFPLIAGIIAYGLVLSVFLSLLLVATAAWLRRTVPLIMVWATFFVFFRLLPGFLVNSLHYPARWRLLDLWNNTYMVGSALLGIIPFDYQSDRLPAVGESALVLGALSVLCLIYLNHRIRAVEIVA